MVAKQTKKMNVALDMDVLPWLEIESGRRGCTMTALINAALREQRDGAPEHVKQSYEFALKSRELDKQEQQ